MDRIPEGFYSSMKNYDVSPAVTSIDWPASYPYAYVGDAKKATREKGKRIVEAHMEKLVDMIRKIKRDNKVLAEMKEFKARASNP